MTEHNQSIFHRMHSSGRTLVRVGGVLFLLSLAVLVISDSNNLEGHSSGRQLLALSSKARDRVNRWHKLPRRDFTNGGADVSNNLSGDQEYAMGLASLASSGVMLGLLCWLFGFTFIFARCCCACCGRKPRKEGYSSTTVNVHKFLWGFLFILAVVGCVLAMVGSTKFNDGLLSVFDTFITVIQNVTSQVDNDIRAPLATLTGDSNVGSGLTGSTADVQKTINDFKDTVKGIDDIRNAASQGLAGIMILLGLIAIIGALFGKAWLCWITIVFAVFFLFITWLLFGIHMSLAAGTADVCIHFDNYIARVRAVPPTLTGADGEEKDVISEAFPCIKPSDSNDIISRSSNGAVGLRDAINFALPSKRGAAGCPSSTCTALTFTAGMITADVLNPTTAKQNRDAVRAEVSALKTGLTTSSPGLPANDLVVTQLDNILEYVTIVEKSQDLIGCNVAANAFDTVQGPLCDTTLAALELGVIGWGMLSAAMMLGVVVIIRGSKRWQKDALAYVGKDYEMGGVGAAAGGPYYSDTSDASSWDSEASPYSADQISLDRSSFYESSSSGGSEEWSSSSSA